MSDDEDDLFRKKLLLIAMSFFAGLITYAALAKSQEMAFVGFDTKRFLIAVGVALGYPIAGAVAVLVCWLFRNLAHPDGVKDEWTLDDHLIFGAFWPLILPISVVLYSFLAIINRMFR